MREMEATGNRRRVKSSRWTGTRRGEMVGGGTGRKGAIAVPVVVVVVSLVSQEGVVGCGRAEVWVGWRTFVAELGVFLHG